MFWREVQVGNSATKIFSARQAPHRKKNDVIQLVDWIQWEVDKSLSLAIRDHDLRTYSELTLCIYVCFYMHIALQSLGLVGFDDCDQGAFPVGPKDQDW